MSSANHDRNTVKNFGNSTNTSKNVSNKIKIEVSEYLTLYLLYLYRNLGR